MKKISQDRFNESITYVLYNILLDLKAQCNGLLNKENEALLQALQEKYKEVQK